MKGAETRAQIMESALRMMSLEGLESLSIGRLAKAVGLSKSGLFAHFKSKEALQIQVLEHAAEEFINRVVRPAITKDKGLPRLRAIVENWLAWASAGPLPGGCVFVAGAAELDDRPGPLRDHLIESQTAWIETLARAWRQAQDAGHLEGSNDPTQMAFELYGNMMSFHLYHRLLGHEKAADMATIAFERLVSR